MSIRNILIFAFYLATSMFANGILINVILKSNSNSYYYSVALFLSILLCLAAVWRCNEAQSGIHLQSMVISSAIVLSNTLTSAISPSSFLLWPVIPLVIFAMTYMLFGKAIFRQFGSS